MRRSEDINNPGNNEAKYYILLTVQLFFYEKKKEKVVKTTGHKMYSDVTSAGKKEGCLS